jgi:hypothetical protein
MSRTLRLQTLFGVAAVLPPRYAIHASARFPKFVRHHGSLLYELRKAKGTSKNMNLVPLSI